MIRTMTCADVLPSGRTGFDLTTWQRTYVRQVYRSVRSFTGDRERARYAATLTAHWGSGQS